MATGDGHGSSKSMQPRIASLATLIYSGSRGSLMEAERRQVTVLFTDMVGFTTFSERSGEEAAFTLMQSLAKLMEDAVRDQGGVVQGFTGDGIMAVFGAPVAFEDAPLRACRAALAILHQVKVDGEHLEAQHRDAAAIADRRQLRTGGRRQSAGRPDGGVDGPRRHRQRRCAPASLGRARFALSE